MSTKKRYETYHDAQIDRLFNPPRPEPNLFPNSTGTYGQSKQRIVTVVYRPLDFRSVATWCAISLLSGAFAGGVWIAFSWLGDF